MVPGIAAELAAGIVLVTVAFQIAPRVETGAPLEAVAAAAAPELAASGDRRASAVRGAVAVLEVVVVAGAAAAVAGDKVHEWEKTG